MGFKRYWARQFANPHGFGRGIATFLMNRMNKQMCAVMQREIKNNTTILDIGFGNGYVLQKLIKQSNSTFYGIDISPDMVRTATRRNPKATLALSSVDHIPFDIKFGQIYTMNTVYFWNDLDTALKEIHDKLQLGGEFINIFRNKEWLDKTSFTKYEFKKYTENELVDATKRAGFDTQLFEIKKGVYYIKAIRTQ